MDEEGGLILTVKSKMPENEYDRQKIFEGSYPSIYFESHDSRILKK